MPNTKDEKPVGYASPPVRSRFKPGQSGNPSGRPKKTKSLKVELIEELEELTSVVEYGQKVASDQSASNREGGRSRSRRRQYARNHGAHVAVRA